MKCQSILLTYTSQCKIFAAYQHSMRNFWRGLHFFSSHCINQGLVNHRRYFRKLNSGNWLHRCWRPKEQNVDTEAMQILRTTGSSYRPSRWGNRREEPRRSELGIWCLSGMPRSWGSATRGEGAQLERERKLSPVAGATLIGVKTARKSLLPSSSHLIPLPLLGKT